MVPMVGQHVEGKVEGGGGDLSDASGEEQANKSKSQNGVRTKTHTQHRTESEQRHTHSRKYEGARRRRTPAKGSKKT